MIVSMKWDPTGKILLTCAKEETVKLWGYVGGCWRRLHSLASPALVNGIAWCALPGKGPKLQLLLATYVVFLIVYSSFAGLFYQSPVPRAKESLVFFFKITLIQ